MSSIKAIFRRRLIKLISGVYDPLVETAIGNQRIKIQMSHPLRENISVHPELNYNLARLVKYTEDKNKNVKVIDIGANIGDTAAYIRNMSNAPILCIDGDDRYMGILKQNVAQYNNVAVCHALVGAETKEINAELKEERGTAIVVESSKKVSVKTIEDILIEFPDFKDSKILKIDTDGFDTIILKGSPTYLKSKQPVLFFEFDPHYIKFNDDPFSLFPFLESCGYKYFMFYMSNGDYVLSCDISNKALLNELVHYFSGRKVAFYTDICAFAEKDKNLFQYCVENEVAHFQKARAY